MGVLQRLTAAAVRRPAITLALVAVFALAGGVFALGLKPSAATDTFVPASSPAYRATVQAQRDFGSDAIVVLIHEPLTELLAPAHLATLTRLEACLAGQSVTLSRTLHADVPVAAAHATPYGGADSPCAELMRHRSALVVYGPGTFLNRAVAAVNAGITSSFTAARNAGDRAARAAYRLALARGLSKHTALVDAAAARQDEDVAQLQRLEQTAVGSGLNGVPSVTDESFLRQIVFGAASGVTTPQSRFAYLFPNARSALIQVRLRASLSPAAQARAIAWIRGAVRMPQFALPAGGSVTVTGVPVVLNDLSGQITGAIGELLGAALVGMALTLLIVFRGRLRLLPLIVALAACGITFGLLSIAGVSLTLASVAVAPVLIGLAVDYGVQFQSRVREATEGPAGAESVTRATGRAAPAITTAALATAVGFLVLLLSPVPMVRGFGVLLVVGIAVALGCTLTAVPAALVLVTRGPRRRRGGGGLVVASARGAGEILAAPLTLIIASLRGAGEILAIPARAAGASVRGAADILHLPRDPQRTLAALVRHPARVIAVGLVLAAAGWVADGATPVQSDITRLVPQSSPSIHELRALEATTGVSGEIDVTVRGADVATPATVRWMSAYQSTLLRHFGYHGSCSGTALCPALSLPDLFSATGTSSATTLTQTQINSLLSSVPAYFSSAVLTSDRREATLAFGIELMPLARQERVIEYMRAHLHPPAGVSAALTGLPVLAAQADAALSSPGRRLLEIAAGLVAVALVLLLVLRTPRRALVPMIPIVLATGWSALILYLVGIPLNPMSATLGALVIAISTEFSVLLSERFGEERAAGYEPAEALLRTYRSTGTAVLASGITAIVGFGVLVLSDIAMLRDFGLVTLVDLSVSLVGVLLVLPAALTLRPRADAAPGSAAPAPAPGRPRPQVV
jgi:hydrophobe/amphiphile efflux-3 (HAE3) family protein